MNIETLTDDILVTIGMAHDDAARSREAVRFNVLLAINNLWRLRVEKEISVIGDRGVSAAVTYIVPLQQDAVLDGRTYFDLPGHLMDLRTNGGVSYIRYVREGGCPDDLLGTPFTHIAPAEAFIRSRMNYQRPSPRTPYYWRATVTTPEGSPKERVYLLGPTAPVTHVEAALYMAVDLDAPHTPDHIPPDMAYHVKRIVLSMERFALLVPQEQLKNDGRSSDKGNQVLQPPQMVSVNDPSNLTVN